MRYTDLRVHVHSVDTQASLGFNHFYVTSEKSSERNFERLVLDMLTSLPTHHLYVAIIPPGYNVGLTALLQNAKGKGLNYEGRNSTKVHPQQGVKIYT